MTLNWTDKTTGDQLSAVEINNIAGELISHSDLFSTKVSLSASQQAIQALIDLRATQVSLGNLDTRVANLEGVTDDDSAFATQVSLGNVKVSLGALDARVVSIENNGTSSYSDNDVASYLVSLGTSIIPDANALYDLGSAEKKIRHLYLSANSMYLGDENQTDPNDMLQVSKAWLEGRASSESLNNLDAGMQAQFSGLNQDLFDTSVDLSNTKADVDSIFGRTDDILATTPIDIKGATEGAYQGTATMTVASGFSFTSQFAGAGIVTTAERFYVIKGDTNGVVLSANSTTYTISRTLEYGYYVWTFGDSNGYSLLSNYVILLVAEDGVNLSSYDINDIHLYDAAFGGFINSSNQSYNNTTDTVDSNSNPITYTGFESTSTYFSSAISGTNVTSLANYSSPFSSNVSSVDILGAPTFSSDQINIQISLRGVLSGEIGYVNIKKVSGGSTATDYLGVSIPFEIETGTIDGASILNIYVDDSDPHTTLEYIQNKAKYLSHNTTPQATATNFGFFLSTEIQQPQLLQIDYTDNNTAYTTNSFSYFDLSSDISIEAEAASTITGLSQRVSTLEGITDDDSAYATKVSLGQLDTRLQSQETLSAYTIATLPSNAKKGTTVLVEDGNETGDGVALAYWFNGVWYRSSDNAVVADRTIDIYLLAGQSNAHGWADTANGLSPAQATQDGIFYTSWHNNTQDASDTQYYSDWATSLVAGDTRGDSGSSTLGNSLYFGPELGFASRGNAINISNDKPLGIIKYAVGSSALTDDPSDTSGGASDWDLTATGYRRGDALRGFKLAVDDAVTKLNNAGYSYRLAGMVWWQQMAPTVTDTTNLMTHIRNWLDSQGYLDMQASHFPIVITKNGHGTDLTPVASADAYIGIVDAAIYGHSNTQNHVGASADGTSDTNNNSVNDMFEIGEAYADEMQLAISGSTNAAWDPSSITTRLWVDMDDQSTQTTSGGIVTQINDKSGNSYNFVPSTTSGNTTITQVSSAQNGKNILRFDNNSDATSHTTIAFSSTAVHKWYFVVKVTASDNQDALFTYFGTNPTLQMILFNMSGAGVFSGDWFMSPGTHMTGNSTNLLNQWVMLSAEWDIPNQQASLALNTTEYNTNVAQSGLSMGSASVRINDNNNSGTQTADSDWGEIVCVENANQATCEKIEGYLAHKWGIDGLLPTSHAYHSAPP